jgi:hypothetical protein
VVAGWRLWLAAVARYLVQSLVSWALCTQAAGRPATSIVRIVTPGRVMREDRGAVVR